LAADNGQFKVNIEIPNQVNELLNRLGAHSYRAYIVGRCVRELIGGTSTVDFDIITDAEIGRIRAIFDIYNVNIDNLIKGEIIVTVQGMPVLIAPYRKGFTEKGSPIYTESIIEDLQRRDFSFNAIAYNPREGFIDPFGGVECLLAEQPIVDVIKMQDDARGDTPGALQKDEELSTFERNPVSILQALGYYSSGDYIISPAASDSIFLYKDYLNDASPSDLRTELSWVLHGRNTSVVLEEYADVFIALVPEFAALAGFDLKRPEYSTDALTHTFRSVGYASPILSLRYAMLFHSLGKPDCFSEDEGGNGHFHGHAERSFLYAQKIMRRMGFSEDETREVGFLIKNQSVDITNDRRSLKMRLREMPPERLKMLLQFKYADLKARSPEFESAAMACKKQVDAVNEIVAMKECYALHQLAINRYDLIQSGLVRNDEHANTVLERLLDMVIDAPAFNTRTRLLGAAEKIMRDIMVK
jgi:tRNA nucleotidyltransferase (CCA-adding enzyme)